MKLSSFIIQFSFRIGRGGRFGRKGVAINFVTNEDIRTLRDIETFYNTQIEEMPMNVADLIWDAQSSFNATNKLNNSALLKQKKEKNRKSLKPKKVMITISYWPERCEISGYVILNKTYWFSTNFEKIYYFFFVYPCVCVQLDRMQMPNPTRLC